MRYDGTGFSGWAKQPLLRTVQGLLEDALAKQPPGESVPGSIVVAGRTDAGVHATGQVVHVDAVPISSTAGKSTVSVDEWGIPDLERMCRRWNRYLPADVRVTGAEVAHAGFDARFSALRRHYRYQVSDAPWGVDPLHRVDTLSWNRPLDVERMNRACTALHGLNDFAAFCKQRAGASTVRQLQRFRWHRDGQHEVYAEVSADAFCHSMVRSLVGAALFVGDGRRDVAWPERLLESGKRTSAVAPAHGLTLVGVDYPEPDQLAARAARTRRHRAPGNTC